MSRRVVDASVFVRAFMTSQQDGPARRLLAEPDVELMLPPVAGQEFINAVWKLERRGIAASVEVNRAIE